MPILGILEVVFQIYCIVHCIRNRQSSWWILFILFVPIIGSAVYFITEILPEKQRRQHFRGGTANASPLRYRPPAKKVEQLREDVAFSNTIKNRENLADELVRQQKYDEAIPIYQACLTGPNTEDVGILFKLAEASFAQKDYATSIESLHKIRALSDYRVAKVRILLARSYAQLGELEKAENHFKQAVDKHGDIEIRYRYAEFLHEQQRLSECKLMLTNISNSVERMPPHARKLNKEWIKRAKQAQKALK